MKSNFLTLFFCFSTFLIFAQNKHTISGFVQEAESGENLIGVSVYDKASKKGTTTNQYGFYSLTLEEGVYTLIYSFIGLESVSNNINLRKNIKANISLNSISIT